MRQRDPGTHARPAPLVLIVCYEDTHSHTEFDTHQHTLTLCVTDVLKHVYPLARRVRITHRTSTATQTPTASATASWTATPTCFFTPVGRPRVTIVVGAVDLGSLIGVCIQCGSRDPGVGDLIDPGPLFTPFDQGALDQPWVALKGLGMKSALSAWGGGFLEQRRLRGDGEPAGRAVQNLPTPTPSPLPATCYAINGTYAVPFPVGDGYSIPCFTCDASLAPCYSDTDNAFFVADFLHDVSADSSAVLPTDWRMLQGWSPTAAARISSQVYAIARSSSSSYCVDTVVPSARGCGRTGGLTLMFDANMNGRRRSFSYAGTATAADVISMVTYAPDDTTRALIMATSFNGVFALTMATFDALTSFATDAASRGGVEEVFALRGLFKVRMRPSLLRLRPVARHTAFFSCEYERFTLPSSRIAAPPPSSPRCRH